MMRLSKYSWIILLALALTSSLLAIEITGRVQGTSGDTAAIVTDGDVVPSVGDKAEIFFKLDGVDGEISVATGSVQTVGGGSVELKIESATGEVAKGQLVRIISPMAQKRADAQATASPATSAPRKSDTPPLPSAETAYELGLQYSRGGGKVLIDGKKSFESFQRAAEQNLPEAQARLAELWSERGFYDFLHAPDPAKAAELAKRALAGGLEARADAGKHQSEYELAWFYFYGLGVQKDEDKAAKLFRAAADQGNKDAKVALGHLYWEGTGVKPDFKAAEGYFKAAAAEDVATARLLLGILYSIGAPGVPSSQYRASALFQQAAEQGLPSAMDKLAQCFEKGCVPQNLTRAVEWYQRAADRGLWSSQQKLGEMYEQGRGVTKDLAKAAEYYQKVADQDIKQGKDALERLRAVLPPPASPSPIRK